MKNTCGVMVLSLDLELAWGDFDNLPVSELDVRSLEERNHIKSLLGLLDRYEIPATWATVGHLMLDSCARDQDGQAHAKLTPHARYSWFPGDWFCFDPCTKGSLAPGWYALDIVEWIRGAKVRHEIASHSFAHIYYGDSECTPLVAEADLEAAVEAAAQKGISLKSFVFPRNQVGHLEVLKRFGLTSYRGEEPPLISCGHGVLQRAIHFLDQILALTPRSVRAEEALPGLWNIPGNHLYMARNGIRRFIPMASRVRKGKRGIDWAVRTGGLYHFWFHPFNLNVNAEAMFSGLERIFSYASRMRAEGRLQILTMDEYVQRLEKEKKEFSAVS